MEASDDVETQLIEGLDNPNGLIKDAGREISEHLIDKYM
jgi:hypothetical protein